MCVCATTLHVQVCTCSTKLSASALHVLLNLKPAVIQVLILEKARQKKPGRIVEASATGAPLAIARQLTSGLFLHNLKLSCLYNYKLLYIIYVSLFVFVG